MARCKSCGKEIVFFRTLGGKEMPFDLKSTQVLVDGKMHTGQVCHWATCPNASAHRKKPTTGYLPGEEM